jgi:hypothetical protein
MFGIVLAKLLLCGESVETDIFDWRKQTILDLECSFEPYWWLVKICFSEKTPTEFLRDFTISIISHLSSVNEDTKEKRIEEIVSLMKVYLGERQSQMTQKVILGDRYDLRSHSPENLKDALTEFNPIIKVEQEEKKNSSSADNIPLRFLWPLFY